MTERLDSWDSWDNSGTLDDNPPRTRASSTAPGSARAALLLLIGGGVVLMALLIGKYANLPDPINDPNAHGSAWATAWAIAAAEFVALPVVLLAALWALRSIHRGDRKRILSFAVVVAAAVAAVPAAWVTALSFFVMLELGAAGLLTR